MRGLLSESMKQFRGADVLSSELSEQVDHAVQQIDIRISAMQLNRRFSGCQPPLELIEADIAIK